MQLLSELQQVRTKIIASSQLASLLGQRPKLVLTPTQGQHIPTYARALAWIRLIRRSQSWISHLGFLINNNDPASPKGVRKADPQNKSQYRTPGAMQRILLSNRRSSVQATPPFVLDRCRPLSQTITNCRTSARLDKRCTASQVWA